jgi:NAD(P)-dependent dehydrogenase (short-subunit alcohol dehydrogenase family)
MTSRNKSSPCAVVVGGTGHLGSSVVERLLKDDWCVIAVARRPEGLEALERRATSRKKNLHCLSGDGYSPIVLDQVARVADLRNWSIEGWVNNANTVSGSNQLLNLDPKVVDEDLAALGKVIIATEFAAKVMIGGGVAGSIVNVASMYGVVSPDHRLYGGHREFQNPPAYGVVKAGVINFSRYCAAHLGEYKIRVNSVSPGPFPRLDGSVSGEFVSLLADRVPLRRTGQPSEFAAVVAFLLGGESTFVTGDNLIVDGGWTLW